MTRNCRVPDTSKFPLDQQLDQRDTATLLAELGFHVIPVKPRKKFPPVATEWQKIGYRKHEEVRAAWTAGDGSASINNVGIVPDGTFFILDFDKAKGGVESYNKLAVLDDKLPDTFKVETHSGGYHLYYACDEKMNNGSGVLKHMDLPGVDVRTAGGYAVAPGGVILGKKSTGHYRALNSLPMAQAPEWLVKELKTRKPKTSERDEPPAVELDTADNMDAAVLYLENDAPEAVEGAGGDHTTYAVAAWLRDLGLSENAALDMMLNNWNETKAIPPWDPDDLATKVRNAFNHAQNQHGIKAAALPQHEFPPLTEQELADITKTPKPTTPKLSSRETPPIHNMIERWNDVTEPDTEWLIEGIIPKNAFATLYGQPGSYKSFVALYLAAMLADGRHAFGRRTRPATKDVVYIAAEGGSGLRKRLDAIELVHGIKPPSVGFIRHPLDLRGSLAHCDQLLKAIKDGGWKPDLIVVDTLARSFGGGNENSSEDMGAFISIIDHIRVQTGAAVLVVHHSGKDTAKGMRGHSALFGAVDSELEVEKIRNAPEEGPGVGGGKLRVTKQKDGPDGYALEYAVEKVMLEGEASAAEEFAEGGEEGTPARGVKSSLAVREWKDGEAKAVELIELKLSPIEYEALKVLQNLEPNNEGCVRSDVWKKAVIRRGICNAEQWIDVRKSLKKAGTFTSVGTKFVAVDWAVECNLKLLGGEEIQSTANPPEGGS